MENLLVAFSNFPALNVIKSAYDCGDLITTSIVTFVALASFTSHLFECHKHGMPGLGLSTQVSYILNRMDFTGAVLTGLRFGYLYYMKYGMSYDILLQNKLLVCIAIVGAILNIISEYDQNNPNLKWIYIPTHMAWHIIVFSCMDIFYGLVK